MAVGPNSMASEESLHDRLLRVGSLPAGEAIAIVCEVARQVESLREQGLLHLRIDASQVFIDGDSRVRLATANVNAPDDMASVDVYQVAALLCRLLTNKPVAAYLRSPRTKQEIPACIQPLLDETLSGRDATGRADIAEFRRRAEACLAMLSEAAPSLAEVPDGASPPELPFRTLGHYEILGRIGRGGMGDVYKGRDAKLQRDVAIKVLPRELARQADFVGRFYAEASAAAKVVHPHIIPIYFIGEDHEHHFFAMQYVRGESLGELLARRRRLSIDETLALVAQVLSGLAAAHRHSLVHRDIKPGNILIDHEHHRAVLADFGLVKVADSNFKTTATGMVMGTVDYISPEQGRGHPVDGRSDLYSLGVLMYQMVSGQLPFSADSATAMLFQHVYEQPRPVTEVAPHVPARLATVIAKLLAKAPSDRFQSADELLVEIESLRKNLPPTVLPDGDLDELATDVELVDPPRRTSIISAPELAELPAIPLDLAEPPRTHWWRRSRDQLLGRLQAIAPELSDRLQNTQQLVRGAVAESESRRDQLLELVAQATAVCRELQGQADANRQAAQSAARRAQTADGDAALRDALRVQTECEQTARELDVQVAEQQAQLDEMRLKLAQVNATHERLRNQRDQLQARLRMANARYELDGGATSARSRTKLVVASVAVAVIVTTVGIALIAAWGWRGLAGSSTDGQPEVFSPESLEPFVSEGYDPETLTPNDKLTPAASDSDTGPSLVPLRQLVGHAGEVAAVAYSPVGELIASSSYDESIRFWDPDTGRNLNSILEKRFATYHRIQFSADGRLLVGSTTQMIPNHDSIQVWDVATGKMVRSMAKEMPIAQMAVDSEKRTVIGLRSDKNLAALITWSLDSGQETGQVPVAHLQVDFSSMALSPRGDYLALISNKSGVALIGTASGQVERTIETGLVHELRLAFSADGTVLGIGALGRRPMRYLVKNEYYREFYGVTGDDYYCQVQVWKPDTGERLGRFTSRSKIGPNALVFSPDGQRLAVANGDVIRVWDVHSARPVQVLRGHTSQSLAYSRDGRSLVSGGGTGKPRPGINQPFLLQWNVAENP